MEDKVGISKSDHALDILERFNQFRKNNMHCDFIIRSGSNEMPVHRSLISASSEYFDAMLSHDTKENREGTADIQQVDPDCVSKCVDFMYTGEVSVSKEKQKDLMHVARMFQLPRLCNGIAVFLEKKLNCSSFFSTKKIADTYDCKKLVETCHKFACRNFRAIANFDNFKNLEADYLKHLLSSKELKESDSIKCKSLIMWINYDSDRASSLFDLIQHIDMSKLPMSYRRFLTENEPVVSNSVECLRHVMKSVFDSGNTESHDVSLGESTDLLSASVSAEIIIFDSSSSVLKCFNLSEKTWRDMRAMHYNMEDVYCSAVVLNDYLYVFTGAKLTYRLAYKTCNADWERMADRIGNWGKAVVLNGIIYSVDDDEDTSEIECFDPVQDDWSFAPTRSNDIFGSAITVARYKPDSESRDSVLILIGGYNDDGNVTTIVEYFDHIYSSWCDAPSLIQARTNSSATTFNEAVYVFGGCDDSGCYEQSAEILFPNANSWELVPLTGFTRDCFSSYTIGRKIYLVGSNESNFKTIDEYDPHRKDLETVTTLSDMSVFYFSSVAVAI